MGAVAARGVAVPAGRLGFVRLSLVSVFLADVRRTTRRGRPALLRTGYAAALLIALAVVFARWFGVGRLAPTRWFDVADLPNRDVARFAHEFAIACFVVQVAAVLVITPAFTAGAIAEERQRRTLDDLLITGLSSRRIVFGKLAARWVQLVGVLLAGVPVFAISASWGGVDVLELALGFAATALLALAAAAIGLWASVEQRSVNAAVLMAYCVTIPVLVAFGQTSIYGGFFVGMLCTFAGLLDLQTLMIVTPVGGLLAFTGLLGLMAARRLRLTDLARVEDWPPRPKPRRRIPFARPASRPRPVPFVRPAPPPSPVIVPGPHDEPLLWRERRFGRLVGRNAVVPVWSLAFVTAVATVPLLLAVVFGVARSGAGDRLYEAAARLLVFGPLAGMVLAATMSAASSVTRERERQTLDGLLTLPGGRAAVLRAKWLGVFGRDRAIVWAAAVPLALGLLLGGFHPLAMPVLAVGVAVHLVLGVTLGLACSVVAGTTTRACVGAGIGLLAMSVVPLFGPEVAWLLSPAAAWWAVPRFGDRHLQAYGIMVTAAAVFEIAAAFGLWLWARYRFEREADD